MASPILSFPNYLDNTFFNVAMGGGNWSSTLPLANLKDPALSKVAQSNGVTDADLTLHIDLGNLRGVRVIGIPEHNGSLTAQARFRGSSTISFEDCVCDFAESVGDSSMTIRAGDTDVSIAVGDIFSFAGHSTVYECTVAASATAGNTDVVSFDPPLTSAVQTNESLVSHTGDHSSAEYDSTTFDAYSEIYPYGSIDHTHESWWTGKPTEEQRQNMPFPIIKTFGLAITRYWKLEFFDSSNADGYLRIPRLWIGPGWQPPIGISYGANSSFITDTRVDTTLGGRRIYGREPIARTLQFEIRDLREDEALSNAFDIQWEAGIDKQVFFVFNPSDTALMHRRAFLATLERPSALQYPYFNRIHSAFELREVVA